MLCTDSLQCTAYKPPAAASVKKQTCIIIIHLLYLLSSCAWAAFARRSWSLSPSRSCATPSSPCRTWGPCSPSWRRLATHVCCTQIRSIIINSICSYTQSHNLLQDVLNFPSNRSVYNPNNSTPQLRLNTQLDHQICARSKWLKEPEKTRQPNDLHACSPTLQQQQAANTTLKPCDPVHSHNTTPSV